MFKDRDMKEFKEIKAELEKRNEVYFEVMIPAMGSAGTIEGEMLRAINKIIYRYYNDGDYFFQGYGCETAGPAHAFLMSDDIPGIMQEPIRTIMGIAENTYGQQYDALLYDVLEIILNYIDSREGNYAESDIDMYSYTAWFQDEEEDEDICWDCGCCESDCTCGYDDEEE